MNMTTPQEIVTYLPKEIRESENKQDLISYIIRGYRALKLPQDKQLVDKIIQLDNTTNYSIPDNIKNIQSIEYVHTTNDCEDCYQTTPIYPSEVINDLCSDTKRCTTCGPQYSIVERTLRLPQPGTYRIVYQQLFSDNLEIFDDEDLKNYLASYATFVVTYNRSRRGDASQNLLTFDQGIMNTLYTKARGAVIMRAIKLQDYRLNTQPIKLHYDEFNNRYYSSAATG